MTQSIKINKSVPITNIVTDIENLLSELTNYISIQLTDDNYPALTISGTPDTSQVDADLLDGQEGSYYTDADNIIYDNTTSGLSAVNVQAAIDEVDSIVDTINMMIDQKVDEFIVPLNGDTVVWHKVGELTTNIGPSENNLTLLVSGVSDFGSNKPGVDVVQISTRRGVSVDVYSLITPGLRSQTYGYVNNTSTGKTEIWVKRNAYTYETHFAVLNVCDDYGGATYGNLASSSTEPSGIVYVDIKTHWTSGNDGSGSGLDADTLDGYHASQTPTANQIPVLSSSSQIKLPFVQIPILINGQDLMSRTFYVDAVNGDDANDGSEQHPFRTIKQAVLSTPVGASAEIYLKYDQTYNINIDNTVVIYNKHLRFLPTGTGTNNPKIIFKSRLSNGYYSNCHFGCYGSCVVFFYHVDVEVERRPTTNYYYSSGAVGVKSIDAGQLLVLCKDCNITIGGLGLVSGRDGGFASAYMYGCTINDVEGAVLHVTNGAGVVVSIGSNIAHNRWANGVVKDTNGVPRNVISNVII